ncbi:MAG TPA: PA2169 family four-helix-bundle protein [Burkholderiaceae bacterium]|nr:PA2169 family four-helix-bundle protein [Burkholderiaceae bacterium]
MSNDDVIDVLNDLIETCKDGEYGFKASSEHAKSPELKNVFTARGEECRRAAEELQAQVVALGGKPDNSGSASGAMHRGWISVRSVLTGYDDKAMLDECERGEDVAVASYRKALEKDLPANIRSLVERQAMGAQRNHDQIKALRDRYPATT